MINEAVGLEIEVYPTKVTKETDLDLTGNTIILNMVDNIESRKEIFNMLRGLPVKMIDGRMGGEGWQILICDLSDEVSCEDYEKTLQGEFKEMPCGENAIIYSVVNQVSEVVNIVKKIIKKQPIPIMVRRKMTNYQILIRTQEVQI